MAERICRRRWEVLCMERILCQTLIDADLYLVLDRDNFPIPDFYVNPAPIAWLKITARFQADAPAPLIREFYLNTRLAFWRYSLAPRTSGCEIAEGICSAGYVNRNVTHHILPRIPNRDLDPNGENIIADSSACTKEYRRNENADAITAHRPVLFTPSTSNSTSAKGLQYCRCLDSAHF